MLKMRRQFFFVACSIIGWYCPERKISLRVFDQILIMQ